MASKRDLKRQINYICSELFAECVAASLYKDVAQENVDSLLSSILKIHSNYILRISHPEPGMPCKVYYKDLIDHFNNDISEVIHIIGTL